MPGLVGIAVGLLVGVGATVASARTLGGDPLDRCNVIWDSPSSDSSGSMPLGNGDIGLNLWLEHGGDLLFYISKTDAWSEIARLQKLGRVRVRLTPNPFVPGRPLFQTRDHGPCHRGR